MTIKLGLSDSALQERRAGIGGSDAYTVVHGSAEDRYQLWQEKIGEKKPCKIMSDWAYALRHVTETLQLDWYEHMNPGVKIVGRGEMLWSTEHRFMFATYDGIVSAATAVPALRTGLPPIDCKHLSRWTKDERDWAIEHYTAQMHHQALILDADYGLISMLHGEKEPEIIRIDVDPFYAETLIERERVFWQAVVEGVPPPDCAYLDVPKVAVEIKRLRTVAMPTFDDKDWPEFVRNNNWAVDAANAIQQFVETEKAHKAHMASRDEIKKAVPEDIGEMTRGTFTLKRSKSNALTMINEEPKDA